jgi:hypothetical protein
VKERRLPQLDKVEHEVKARLKKEMIFWDSRAQDLKLQEKAGKQTRLPASEAQRRADALSDRLERRMADLKRERLISPNPPRILGGALVLPLGLVKKLQGVTPPPDQTTPESRDEVEHLAMEAVFEAERRLGREPRDVSDQKGLGYDIESKDPAGGLYFIEVKGRAVGNDEVCLMRSQLLCALNEPEKFRLAVVVVDDGEARAPVYVTGYDYGQPGFGQTSAQYPVGTLLAHGDKPA